MKPVVVFGLGSTVVFGLLFAACSSPDDTSSCLDTRTCPSDAGNDVDASGGSGGTAGTGGTGGTSGTGGTAGTSGTGGEAGMGGVAGQDAGDAEAGAAGEDGGDGGDAEVEAEPYCDPTSLPGDDVCVIDDLYGVFVSPSGTDSPTCGTQASPCGTIGQAMTRAKADDKRVYACGDGGTFAESVSVDAALDGLTLFGGFECGTWDYAPTTIRTHVMPAGEGVAWTVDGLTTGLEVNDFAIESRSATTAGASSIAAVVRDSVGVVFRNSTFVAGDGAKGADGVDGVKGANGAIAGAVQIGKSATCTDAINQAGGQWPFSAVVCGSQGGKGGDVDVSQDGEAGAVGLPQTNVVSSGMGGGGAGSTDPLVPGGTGGTGSDGNPGGNGGAAASAGLFSASGFTVASGHEGTDGFPGQGGGGGGAGASIASCTGASGGAGGMGGCGGKLGTGGAGGGASVALLSWSSSVTLDACVLTAADGGDGGRGGNGGAGGDRTAGANGGNELLDGSNNTLMANGGKGGPGGFGGPAGSGSGGTGGPSYALVYHGDAPVETGSPVFTSGNGGAKGIGGTATGGTKAPDGADGLSDGKLLVP